MAYAISILDKSPVAAGEDPSVAVKRTIALALRAESLGFLRFWVAEHHNTPELASSSPEILIAAIAAHTQTIRVGSGGVMLQHYSPYKVAENFNLLASLFPTRIDVGIGKAPGGLPLSTRALQADKIAEGRASFESQLRDLDRYLTNDPTVLPDGLAATPRASAAGERLLLGASIESARLAAELGWNFVFARHLNGDDVALAAAISTFRDFAGRAPIVAVAAIVDADRKVAQEHAEVFTPYRVTVPGGQGVIVGSEEQAAEYARQAGSTEYRVERRQANVLAGDGRDIVLALDQLAASHGISEFIVDLANTGDSRLHAIELIAAARDAARPTALSA